MHRSYAVPALALLLTAFLSAQQRTASQEKAIAERTIDPTWLYRNSNALPEKPSDITTPTCHYKPMFGQGDSQTSVVVGVARFGEAVLDPGGSCASIAYPGEDQIYTVLDGSGATTYADETVALKKEDFLYIPATVAHACAAAAVPWGHISSGCIYSGAKISANGQVRVEKDDAE